MRSRKSQLPSVSVVGIEEFEFLLSHAKGHFHETVMKRQEMLRKTFAGIKNGGNDASYLQPSKSVQVAVSLHQGRSLLSSDNNTTAGPSPTSPFFEGPILPSAPSPTASGSFPAAKPVTMDSSVLAVIIVVAGLSVLFIVVQQYRKMKVRFKQRTTEQFENSLLQLSNLPVRFSHGTLKKATGDFDIQFKLGHGGFGSVFEGTLSDGSKIAVKRLDFPGQGTKEFEAEVKTIGSIHHVNLVKLIGFCMKDTQKLLVYNYMSNGSLDKWIFCNDSGIQWDTRKKIILQVAKALAYLHEECHQKIIHLDVKPQNVLLDDEFNAKLSDFGMATLIQRDQNYVITQMRGTRGYLAPEWLGGRITHKVDVYSYGVVVLEVMFMRKSFDNNTREEEHGKVLINLIKGKAKENMLLDLLEMCSDDMQQDGEQVEKIMKLAVWCLHINPEIRPSMSDVVKVIEGALSIDNIDITFDSLNDTSTGSDSHMASSTSQLSPSFLSGPR